MQPRDFARRGRRVERVLVELTVRAADEVALSRLRELGLEIEQVMRNKVVGSIAREKLSRLESDELVKIVERSEKMNLNELS